MTAEFLQVTLSCHFSVKCTVTNLQFLFCTRTHTDKRRRKMRKRVRRDLKRTQRFSNRAAFRVNTQFTDIARFYKNKNLRAPNTMIEYTKTQDLIGTTNKMIQRRVRKLRRNFIKVRSPYSTLPYAFVSNYKSYMRRQRYLLNKYVKDRHRHNTLGEDGEKEAKNLDITRSEEDLFKAAMVKNSFVLDFRTSMTPST